MFSVDFDPGKVLNHQLVVVIKDLINIFFRAFFFFFCL